MTLTALPNAGATASASTNATGAARYIYAGLLLILAVFVGLGGWAALASLDGAVIAPGVVVVEGNQKTVQHLEGGIVAELLVREGDAVKAGDVLLRLDDTRAAASLRILEGQLDLLTARKARLFAERDGHRRLDFPTPLMDRAGDPEVAGILAGELTLFEARRQSLAGEVGILKQRIRQFRAEIAGLSDEQAAIGRQGTLILQELDGVRQLHAKGYAPLGRVLELERATEELAGRGGELTAEIARAQGGIGEAELQILQLEKSVREEVTGELAEVEGRIFELAQQRVAAADDLKRIEVFAPIDGIVMGLQAHTLGGVVRAGEPILGIVPEKDRLVIETQVAPQDIDKVAAGQRAMLRLSAFNLRQTPELEGRVLAASPDRFQDQTSGEVFYKARLEIPDAELARLPEGLELLPGMPAEAFIATGERQALSYLLKPLTDALMRTFREE